MRVPLVAGVAWMAVGIALGLERPAPTGSGPFLVVGALAAALVAAVGAARPGSRPRRPLSFRALMLLMCLAGALLGVSTRMASDRSCLQWIPAQVPLAVRGRVLEQVGGGRLQIRIHDLDLDGQRWPCAAVVVARWDHGSRLEPGSGIGARGVWWSPPGDRSRLRRPGALLLDSVWIRAEAGRPPAIGARLRAAGQARVDAVFPRRAGLARSLLLAQRSALDPDLRDRFARAGLSHILAISGLHVGLIAGLLILLARMVRLSRRGAAGAASLGTFAYVALIGAPHSAVRAALQIGLVLGARLLQRPTRVEAVIAAAALVLLSMDPAALTRPGFQLSFLGVTGILVLRPPVLAKLGTLTRIRPLGRPVGKWLAEGLATSLAATAATAPAVAWHFGRVPVVGVLANLVAIPLLAAALPALAVALAVGLVWVPAGRFLAGGASLLLDGLDATATAAAAVPLGSVTVAPGDVLPVTAAALAAWWAARRLGQVRTGVRVLVRAGVAAMVLAVAPIRPPSDSVQIHHIDVGQGDATAVRSPAGRWILVDAGVATDTYDAGRQRVVPYLQRRGARRISGLVITHPDADHMGGAVAIASALRPDWIGGPGIEAGKGQYLDLLTAAQQAGIPWVRLHQGTEIELDGVRIAVVSPPRARDVEDANEASVVLRLVYGRFEALLTGDAPAVVERRLTDRYGDRLEADLLKVGHHGSETSTTEALLAATRARVAVISVGRGNRYGHPDPHVLRRLRDHGIAVFRTDRDGSIVVHGSADGSWRIDTERRRR